MASPLRELTCNMGSHSVTCHPAEVTFLPSPQLKPVLDSATPEGCKAVAVWQPYELLYTCYLLTYSLFRVQAQSSEGERAVSVTGPTACNSLLYDIRKITYTNALKHHLIFYFFNHYFYIQAMVLCCVRYVPC